MRSTFAVVLVACVGFQITAEHVHVPLVDIYAMFKRQNSHHSLSSAARRGHGGGVLSRMGGANMVRAARKPRATSIFGSMLASVANDEEGTATMVRRQPADISMNGVDDDDLSVGMLSRTQSDSSAMLLLSSALSALPRYSSSPLVPVLSVGQKRGDTGANKYSGGSTDSGANASISSAHHHRRRRALDFSEAADQNQTGGGGSGSAAAGETQASTPVQRSPSTSRCVVVMTAVEDSPPNLSA